MARRQAWSAAPTTVSVERERERERERDDSILQSQARPLPLVTRVTQRTPVNEPNMNMTHLERDSPVLLEARLQLEEGVVIPEQPRWDSRPSP
jgi:hypothetical protein